MMHRIILITISCSNDFISEGRKICYLLMNNEVIAVVGYK